MSNEIMSLNPGIGAEVTYRRERLLADAEHLRLLRTAKAADTATAANPATTAKVAQAGNAASTADLSRTANASRTGLTRRARLLDRFLAPGRRIVAAREAPVRQVGPTPLWR